MNSGVKWYNRGGDVIDVATANALLGDPDYKRVGLTEISSATDGVRHLVSTVWLGLDHNFGGGAPLLFETMVFADGENLQEQWADRYSTEAEAKTGHAAIVTVIAATLTGEAVTHLTKWPEPE